MGNVNMEASQIHYRGGNRPMSVEEALKEGSSSASNASIAPEFSETAQYMPGDIVFYEGSLYRFEEEHAAGAWDSTQVMGTNISDNLVMLPGDGLQRIIHELAVKLKADGGLHFDETGAIYADHLPDYRLTEHDTKQQWIDGSPIYAKTEVHQIPSNVTSGITRFGDTSFTADLNVIRAEIALELESGVLSPGGETPWYSSGSALYAGLDSTGLGVYFGGNLYAEKNIYVTLYYTKSV